MAIETQMQMCPADARQDQEGACQKQQSASGWGASDLHVPEYQRVCADRQCAASARGHGLDEGWTYLTAS
jgi:hypothetical protein